MKKLLLVLIAAALLAGLYYAARIWPVFTTDNTGAEKVVLLHGLGRNEKAMWLLESALLDAGYDVFNFAYPSTEETLEVLLDLIGEQIDDCCGASEQTVHFVGHSLGGLLIRDYLGQRRPKHLGYVVLIGSPNKGSELAEVELDESVQDLVGQMAGPAGKMLHTGPDGYPASLPPPDYPVGVIAGTRGTPMSDQWLPVPNDSMVSVESARLDGMTDFIQLDVNHWGLRNDRDVAAQVVFFLSHGQFEHAEPGS